MLTHISKKRCWCVLVTYVERSAVANRFDDAPAQRKKKGVYLPTKDNSL